MCASSDFYFHVAKQETPVRTAALPPPPPPNTHPHNPTWCLHQSCFAHLRTSGLRTLLFAVSSKRCRLSAKQCNIQEKASSASSCVLLVARAQLPTAATNVANVVGAPIMFTAWFEARNNRIASCAYSTCTTLTAHSFNASIHRTGCCISAFRFWSCFRTSPDVFVRATPRCIRLRPVQ